MSIIRVAFDAEWDLPVFVRRNGRYDHAIDGPREALRYLQSDFERRSGELYWRAIEACYSALQCKSDPERARAYFLAAWRDLQTRMH